MKIVFLDSKSLGDTPLTEIEALGDLVCYGTSTPAQARERVADCNVLMVNKVIVDRQLLDCAPHLKLICVCATGTNNIDHIETEKRGIPVRNVAGYSTESVVQTTFMHLLSLFGHAPYFDRRVKDGTYSHSDLFTDLSISFNEVSGKTLGIIGMGTIGSRVAMVATAFGMKVIYFSTSGTGHCKDYPSVSLCELLERSDAVTIHAPLNESTKGLIGIDELKRMKPSAFLVNAGRGGIVDETALAYAVDNGIIAGAALDVYSSEPLPAESPLLHMKEHGKMRFTAHTAWASSEARERLVHMVAENIRSLCL